MDRDVRFADARQDIVLTAVLSDFSPERQEVRVEFQSEFDFTDEWLPFLHMSPGKRFYPVPRQHLIRDAGSARFFSLFRPFVPEGRHRLLLGLCSKRNVLERLPIGDVEGMKEIGFYDVPPLDVSSACRHIDSVDPEVLHKVASAARMPLFLSQDGRLCNWPVTRVDGPKVAVISVPKAGTYLVGRLLESFGLENCKLHLSFGHVEDYRAGSVSNLEDAFRIINVSFSSRLVLPGQFVPSHIEYNLPSRVALSDFAKIFVYRELRQTVVSAFRAHLLRFHTGVPTLGFENITEEMVRTDPRKVMLAWFESRCDDTYAAYKSVMGWIQERNTLAVTFEEIMGDLGPERQLQCVVNVGNACGLTLQKDDAARILSGVIGSRTMTYSGQRSSLSDYWSDAAESLFVSRGFQALNEELGYVDAPAILNENFSTGG